MPIYQYSCQDCQEVFDELWLSFQQADRDEPKYLEEAECPKCKSKKKIRLLAGSTMVSFKGEGWTNRTIGTSTGGRSDSSGALKEHGERIKDEVKNLTSKDLYGM